ncbi:hypothetical protein EDC14_1002149 [Hydrogenispora ethanolica]|jgi:hypothetical protein|uniref:GIY-YIG nuclease family protein n=1 Tax=Hydrogenispora ethanolica TaxID=1082276 RepID=A0A4R1SBK8_HYDET|nr:GIY-YIG nuclease family protein [Hydrogenispora ethanolica]TCL76390.1 hypothetical protein EDC14_1002149 [Hydrogenispora ethanolica]
MDKRAEMKLAYKNRPKHMGIFQIRNRVNGKVLLGSSLNLDGMLNRFQMMTQYDWGWKGNSRLDAEMKAYGPENFEIEILDRLKPNEDPLYDYREDLKALEELWLEKLQPYDERGYHKRKP